MKFLIDIFINAVIIVALSWLLPGVIINGFIAGLIVALVIALLNFMVKPVLVVLTLPVTVITLGLFLLVINAVIILIADWLIPGFEVEGFWYALLFAVCLSIARTITNKVIEKGDD